MARNSSKDLILDVAEELFATRGIENVSLRTVNEETGLSPAAVHYHFKNKENLLKAILLRNMRPVEERDIVADQIDNGELQLNAKTFIDALTYPLETRFLEDGVSGEYFTKIIAQIYIHRKTEYTNYLPDEFIEMGKRDRSLLLKLKTDEDINSVMLTHELIALTWVEGLAGFRAIIQKPLTEGELLEEKRVFINHIKQFLVKALG